MSLLELPEDVLRNIATNLLTPDLLQFLSSHRSVHERLGKSSDFWKYLLDPTDQLVDGDDPRQRYMLNAYMKHLPAVKWYPSHRNFATPREGHLSCIFSTAKEDLLCFTGGYTDDEAVYMMRVDRSTGAWNRISGHMLPEGLLASVYGATLTALDEYRAVRVGGFQDGGYSGETNQVAVLERIPVVVEGSECRHRFQWHRITTQNPQFCVPRAYHTTTLLAGRYLLVMGGMTSTGCVLNEAILDTQTWTWLDPTRIISHVVASASNNNTKPCGRHGHSVILDERRNRLVLFGGGNGTDLLRSGEDKAEVWELKLGDGWDTNLEGSFPWIWNKIHDDPHKDQTAVSDMPSNAADDVNHLSQPEALCLGRCHVGVKITSDTVILLFGSGRPSTNGILAYNLATDSFVRPKVFGPLPTPRFTLASAFIQRHGHLVVHGGYSSQEGNALADMAILDLAPFARDQEFSTLHPAMVRQARCYGPITDDDIQRGRVRSSRSIYEEYINSQHLPDYQRRRLERELLAQFSTVNDYGAGTFMQFQMGILQNWAMMAIQLQQSDDEDNDAEDDSNDQEESDDAMEDM